MTIVLDPTTINIATHSGNPLGRALAYYHSSPKYTLDGKTFHLYAGYYYYMITAGHNTRFLRAKSKADLAVKSRYNWSNVLGLESHLEAVLLYNIKQSPITMEMLKHNNGPIEWREPDRELRNAERRWLRVVQNVVKRLRSDEL